MYMFMRDEKEGRKEQAKPNKQQGKATQHAQGSHFSKENRAALGGTRTHDTLHSIDRALYQLSCLATCTCIEAAQLPGPKSYIS